MAKLLADGTGWVNFNWTGVINRQSVVHVAVSEGRLDQVLGTALDGISRFRGIDWPSPLNVVTDITVDSPEVGSVV